MRITDKYQNTLNSACMLEELEEYELAQTVRQQARVTSEYDKEYNPVNYTRPTVRIGKRRTCLIYKGLFK